MREHTLVVTRLILRQHDLHTLGRKLAITRIFVARNNGRPIIARLFTNQNGSARHTASFIAARLGHIASYRNLV